MEHLHHQLPQAFQRRKLDLIKIFIVSDKLNEPLNLPPSLADTSFRNFSLDATVKSLSRLRRLINFISNFVVLNY